MSLAVERIEITSRDQWLELRKHDLTASDVAAWMGLDDYRSPGWVFASKAGELADNDNAILRRGRWMEPSVIEAVKEECPHWQLQKGGVYLRAPQIRMGATPDLLAIDPEREGIGNVQLKTVARPVFEQEWRQPDGSISAPLSYQIQTGAENILVRAHWSAVAALVVDAFRPELHIVDVPRHPQAEKAIIKSVKNFWKRFEKGDRPEADYAKDKELMQLRYPKEQGIGTFALRDNKEVEALLDEREHLLEEARARYRRKDAIDARLMELMGDAPLAFLRRGRISWQTEIKREHWVEESQSRVLRITWKP